VEGETAYHENSLKEKDIGHETSDASMAFSAGKVSDAAVSVALPVRLLKGQMKDIADPERSFDIAIADGDGAINHQRFDFEIMAVHTQFASRRLCDPYGLGESLTSEVRGEFFLRHGPAA
jgi:hypothetical protein